MYILEIIRYYKSFEWGLRMIRISHVFFTILDMNSVEIRRSIFLFINPWYNRQDHPQRSFGAAPREWIISESSHESRVEVYAVRIKGEGWECRDESKEERRNERGGPRYTNFFGRPAQNERNTSEEGWWRHVSLCVSGSHYYVSLPTVFIKACRPSRT